MLLSVWLRRRALTRPQWVHDHLELELSWFGGDHDNQGAAGHLQVPQAGDRVSDGDKGPLGTHCEIQENAKIPT